MPGFIILREILKYLWSSSHLERLQTLRSKSCVSVLRQTKIKHMYMSWVCSYTYVNLKEDEGYLRCGCNTNKANTGMLFSLCVRWMVHTVGSWVVWVAVWQCLGGVQELLIAHTAFAAAKEDIGTLLLLHTLVTAGDKEAILSLKQSSSA